MINIRKSYPTLRTGSLKFLVCDYQHISYARFDEEEQFIVVINNSPSLCRLTIPVWEAEIPRNGVMRRLVYSYEHGYTLEHEEFLVNQGKLILNMGAHSAIILKTNEF